MVYRRASQAAARMSLKDRAAATMEAGYRVFRVDSAILPPTPADVDAGRARAARTRRTRGAASPDGPVGGGQDAALSTPARAFRAMAKPPPRFAKASARTATG